MERGGNGEERRELGGREERGWKQGRERGSEREKEKQREGDGYIEEGREGRGSHKQVVNGW